MEMSPHAVQTYSLGGTLKYELPFSDVSIPVVFDTMTNAAKRIQGLHILDWGMK